VENPLRWMLHCDADDSEKQIVGEDELADAKLWQSLA